MAGISSDRPAIGLQFNQAEVNDCMMRQPGAISRSAPLLPGRNQLAGPPPPHTHLKEVVVGGCGCFTLIDNAHFSPRGSSVFVLHLDDAVSGRVMNEVQVYCSLLLAVCARIL